MMDADEVKKIIDPYLWEVIQDMFKIGEGQKILLENQINIAAMVDSMAEQQRWPQYKSLKSQVKGLSERVEGMEQYLSSKVKEIKNTRMVDKQDYDPF